MARDRRGRAVAAGGGDVTALKPGRVWSIGDSIASGDAKVETLSFATPVEPTRALLLIAELVYGDDCEVIEGCGLVWLVTSYGVDWSDYFSDLVAPLVSILEFEAGRASADLAAQARADWLEAHHLAVRAGLVRRTTPPFVGQCVLVRPSLAYAHDRADYVRSLARSGALGTVRRVFGESVEVDWGDHASVLCARDVTDVDWEAA